MPFILLVLSLDQQIPSVAGEAAGAHTSICRRLALICLGSIKLALGDEDGTDKALTNSTVFETDGDFSIEIYLQDSMAKPTSPGTFQAGKTSLPPKSEQPGRGPGGLQEVFGKAPFSTPGSPP